MTQALKSEGVELVVSVPLMAKGRLVGAIQLGARETRVFAPEELLPKALEAAAAIARLGTLGVGYAKDAIANGLSMAKGDGFRYEASLFGVLFATEDQKEGMEAFVAKRPAAFRGK